MPKEASPFKLRVAGHPLTIEPGGLETPATVRVRGAFAFEARLDNGEIPARLKRGVDDLSGMVHLAQATEKLTLHANVRARLVDASVKLPGVELRGLTLPCDALTLDDVPEPKPSLEDGGEARFVAKGATLHFRTAPGRGAAVEAAVEDPSALELRRVEEQGGWMRVTTRWPDGTTLTGWVKRDELVEEGMHHERVGDVLGATSGAPPACEAPRVGANERIVAAAVATGTQVFAARYLGPWAKVVDGAKLRAARAAEGRLGRDRPGARDRLRRRRRVDSARRGAAAARRSGARRRHRPVTRSTVTVARSGHERPLRH